jgi:hypothetical protein
MVKTKSKSFLVSCIFTCSLLPAIASDLAVSKPSYISQAERSKDDLRQKVEKVVKKTVESGSGRTAEGVPFFSEASPDPADIETIRSGGDAAISVLEGFVWEGQDPQMRVAVRLIGMTGGETGFNALRRIVQGHRVPSIRIRALRWISGRPSTEAIPIIEKVAQKDRDESVRKVARELLRKH